jgi:hypothetical protein
MSDLERDFNFLMFAVYNRAKKECKYNATYFLKMLGELGGVQTAKVLLAAPTVSDGFVALYERGRLDLTVEAQLLANDKFWSLFDPEDLDTARRWLKKYGWVAP